MDVTLAEHAAAVDRDLSTLLARFAGLVTRIRKELPIRRDPTPNRNVYGEQQLELDLWMNDLFIYASRESRLVSQVASEEMKEARELGRARFSLVLDPLDGSSNVKSNNIFGTIFGIFDGARLPARGSELFAAGYLIYGPATTLVYAADGKVHEFVQGAGGRPEEFFLIHEDIQLPPKGKLYGVGGHREQWIPQVKAFVAELERDLMNLRYGGSFVGERTPRRWTSRRGSTASTSRRTRSRSSRRPRAGRGRRGRNGSWTSPRRGSTRPCRRTSGTGTSWSGSARSSRPAFVQSRHQNLQVRADLRRVPGYPCGEWGSRLPPRFRLHCSSSSSRRRFKRRAPQIPLRVRCPRRIPDRCPPRSSPSPRTSA